MDLATIGLVVEFISLAVLVIACCVYIITIACIRRFRTAVNIIIGNFCLACSLAVTCRGWLDFFYTVYPDFFFRFVSYCFMDKYIPFMNNCLPIYALAMITVNRYLIIRHATVGLFKKRRWALLSSIIPWLVVFILCIPHLILGIQVNILWYTEALLLDFHIVSFDSTCRPVLIDIHTTVTYEFIICSPSSFCHRLSTGFSIFSSFWGFGHRVGVSTLPV